VLENAQILPSKRVVKSLSCFARSWKARVNPSHQFHGIVNRMPERVFSCGRRPAIQPYQSPNQEHSRHEINQFLSPLVRREEQDTIFAFCSPSNIRCLRCRFRMLHCPLMKFLVSAILLIITQVPASSARAQTPNEIIRGTVNVVLANSYGIAVLTDSKGRSKIRAGNDRALKIHKNSSVSTIGQFV
jgi:hypothetical protein